MKARRIPGGCVGLAEVSNVWPGRDCFTEDWSILAPPQRSAEGRALILAKSADGFVVCHWDRDPPGLAGPTWTEANDASRGYLDDYFEGWIDPAELKLWDYATLADLLIAFVDDANARGDERALRVIKARAKA